MRSLILSIVSLTVLISFSGCQSWGGLIDSWLPYKFGDDVKKGLLFDSTVTCSSDDGIEYVFFNTGDFYTQYKRRGTGKIERQWGVYYLDSNKINLATVYKYWNLWNIWEINTSEALVNDSVINFFIVKISEKSPYYNAPFRSYHHIPYRFDTIYARPFAISDRPSSVSIDSSYLRTRKNLWRDKNEWKQWKKHHPVQTKEYKSRIGILDTVNYHYYMFKKTLRHYPLNMNTYYLPAESIMFGDEIIYRKRNHVTKDTVADD